MLHVARVSSFPVLHYIHSVDGHWGCFHFEAITSNACMFCWYTYFLISFGYMLRSGTAELSVDAHFNINRYLSNISKAVYERSCCSTLSPTPGIVDILIFAVFTSVRVSYCSFNVHFLDD